MNAFADALRAVAWEDAGSGASRADAKARESSWQERFAGEQIRALVQQLFFSHDEKAPRLVGFCAIDETTSTWALCHEVARELATRISGDVCLLDAQGQQLNEEYGGTDDELDGFAMSSSLRQSSRQISMRVWLAGARATNAIAKARESDLVPHLRNEFDYGLVQLPTPIADARATRLGSLLDGVVLVVEAHTTRRLVAQRVREALAHAHIRVLGAVLSERTFPIPESIYRRV